MTGGAQAIVEAARKELGNAVIAKPIRLSCPRCGDHLASVFVTPNLLRDRCDRCRVDVIALVTAEGDVVSATDK